MMGISRNSLEAESAETGLLSTQSGQLPVHAHLGPGFVAPLVQHAEEAHHSHTVPQVRLTEACLFGLGLLRAPERDERTILQFPGSFLVRLDADIQPFQVCFYLRRHLLAMDEQRVLPVASHQQKTY